MMMDSQEYISQHENDSFEELIKERNNLVKKIEELEKIAFDDKKEDEAWMVHPGPAVKYQGYLRYLAKLCNYMCKKYNKEIAWGSLLKRKSDDIK